MTFIAWLSLFIMQGIGILLSVLVCVYGRKTAKRGIEDKRTIDYVDPQPREYILEDEILHGAKFKPDGTEDCTRFISDYLEREKSNATQIDDVVIHQNENFKESSNEVFDVNDFPPENDEAFSSQEIVIPYAEHESVKTANLANNQERFSHYEGSTLLHEIGKIFTEGTPEVDDMGSFAPPLNEEAYHYHQEYEDSFSMVAEPAPDEGITYIDNEQVSYNSYNQDQEHLIQIMNSIDREFTCESQTTKFSDNVEKVKHALKENMRYFSSLGEGTKYLKEIIITAHKLYEIEGRTEDMAFLEKEYPDFFQNTTNPFIKEQPLPVDQLGSNPFTKTSDYH